MKEIAVIGAGGYVGSALVEAVVLAGEYRVRAIVRAHRSLAGLARFGDQVAVRIADAENSVSLASAIRGCTVVVNLTTGAPHGIVRSTSAIYEACVAERIKRLVHLSSAVVFGEVLSPEIRDDSPPLRKHWMPYARAKADSERFLRAAVDVSPLEIAVLRPGIIWGPRSPHTLDIARSLLEKRAYLVDGGAGIFNGIYIDNLLHSIQATWDDGGDIRGFYNVGDKETVTWRDIYAALACHLDYDMARIACVSSRRLPWSTRAAIDYLQSLPGVNRMYHGLKSRVPAMLKAALKSRLSGNVAYSHLAESYQATPVVDRELWHLQRTRHKLATGRFCQRFNLCPPVSFDEGIQRTVRWLSHIGLIAHESCCAHG
jgi:nucleoside-diphosphate-sugar epimerase